MGDGIEFVAQLTKAASRDEWLALGRRVEAMGYAGVSVSDHIGPQLAPLVALAALAPVTERLTLGTNVLANDFRHPAMLAKELATLDVLSGGRVVAGIGAGWMSADYEQTGIALDRAGVRIDRLVEAVQVLRGSWADAPFSFHGEHYRVSNLDGQPKPVQRPGPRVLVGGGARRILSEAARHADIVGIALDNRAGEMGEHSWRSTTRDAFREKLAWVHAAAAARPDGRTPPISVRVLLVAVTDARGAAADLGRPVGLDAGAVLDSPHALVGSASSIADTLRRRRDELGIAHYVVSQAAVESLAPVVAALA
jgi:probable F420-dependent oxidoreductase